jgi:hypothetical protein
MLQSGWAWLLSWKSNVGRRATGDDDGIGAYVGPAFSDFRRAKRSTQRRRSKCRKDEIGPTRHTNIYKETGGMSTVTIGALAGTLGAAKGDAAIGAAVRRTSASSGLGKCRVQAAQSVPPAATLHGNAPVQSRKGWRAIHAPTDPHEPVANSDGGDHQARQP